LFLNLPNLLESLSSGFLLWNLGRWGNAQKDQHFFGVIKALVLI